MEPVYLDKTVERETSNLDSKPKLTHTPPTEYNVFKDENQREEYLANLRHNGDEQDTNSKATLTKEQVENINKVIMERYKLEIESDAVMFIGALCQLGGTASGCDGNLSYTFKGKKVTLSEVKRLFKANGLKKGIRKFARKYADDIVYMMNKAHIKGNLHKKIQKMVPNRKFNSEELVWMSDFLVESENIPPDIRELILKSFKTQTTQKPKKKQGKGRKGRGKKSRQNPGK